MEINDKNALEYNAWGQPVGLSLDWQPPTFPAAISIAGTHMTLIPANPYRHAQALFHAFANTDAADAQWTYLPYGPFANAEDYSQWLGKICANPGMQFYCICCPQPQGIFALMTSAPEKGSIELAHVMYSATLRRSLAATEAVYCILKYLFALGYRRCEWKCNALNAASQKAACRYGFSFEGLFRQHMVIKGHNRDTAWFAITDMEWKSLRRCYEQWLCAENFDDEGRQRQSLSALTRQLLKPSMGTSAPEEAL